MPESDSFFKNHLAQTTPYPLSIEIEKAEGVYLWDSDGKRYMDLVAGIGVSAIGHGVQEVKDAVINQMEKHLHVMVYGEFLQKAQIQLAKQLTELLPSELDTCYFVNSGAEAIEASLKLAKRVTGRTKIVSCKKSYHGNTHGALSVTGNEARKYAFRPLLPEVYFVEFDNQNELREIDENTACFILETIQGDAGIRIPSKDYFQAVRKRCDEVGALLILDEIQAGLGRAGAWFAFEYYGVVPDVLALGKGLGAGFPMGAMVASKDNMRTLTVDPPLGHITTFGGHPVICAAAHAGLRYMLDNKLVEGVDVKGKLLFELLSGHQEIKEIRYRGLFFAIELANEEIVRQTVVKCLEEGVILFWFLSCPTAFRIAPPLTISEEEIIKVSKIILNVLDYVSK